MIHDYLLNILRILVLIRSNDVTLGCPVVYTLPHNTKMFPDPFCRLPVDTLC
jgi:hypothetical protein